MNKPGSSDNLDAHIAEPKMILDKMCYSHG